MAKKILFFSYTDFLNPILDQFDNNSGNTIFYSAGASYFYSSKSKNTQLTTGRWDIDYINENFDAFIFMEANVFSKYFAKCLISIGRALQKIKIPVYVLGAGAQSDINYSFDFVKEIETPAKIYMDTILNTGGTVTLRGEFTNEVLKRLGYNNLFVSGCPSMFYNGKNLQISNKKVDKKSFKPMLNGYNVDSISNKIYKDYPESAFFDQDLYLNILYKPETITDFKHPKYNYPFKKLYKEKRILGNTNPYPWRKQIIEGGFNFSYGSRIHGNIIALQENIPAFVKVIDSRTREIADYFKIPNSTNTPPPTGYQLSNSFNETKDSLYELYQSLNYDEFNKTLCEKFDKFKKFLDDNDIPNYLGNNDEFKNHIENIKYPNEIVEIKYKKDILKKVPNKHSFKQLLQNIFSIKNIYHNNIKRKVITIFGMKIKLRA